MGLVQLMDLGWKHEAARHADMDAERSPYPPQHNSADNREMISNKRNRNKDVDQVHRNVHGANTRNLTYHLELPPDKGQKSEIMSYDPQFQYHATSKRHHGRDPPHYSEHGQAEEPSVMILDDQQGQGGCGRQGQNSSGWGYQPEY